MTFTTALILTVFGAVYVGMALGRWPGLRLDRAGIAVLGAIVLYAGGAVSGADALRAIDFPTLIVLFGLMILSAQFAACGFYDWCAARIAASRVSPVGTLALTVAIAGGLSAVLANDIVVFAMTPLMVEGLARRGLDPRPYLIALAGAANAGSAATLIGNPQNILIGQVGRLEFWEFAARCAPPALAGLLATFAVIAWTWRRELRRDHAPVTATPLPALDRSGLAKALVATAALLLLFATPLPQVTGVLAIAAALLISRRRATRDMFALVDWPLLLLFASLFVVTAALAESGLTDAALSAFADAGIDPRSLPSLAVLTLVGSNTIGNVPAVVLLVKVLGDFSPGGYYALAVLSTLAGNLLIVGSLANIIVVERARQAGVSLGFKTHARCGIPMTLVSLAIALGWFAIAGGG